jgi:AraC-like DNA-binding protein
MRQYRELQAQVGSLETKETDAPLPNSEAATEDFEGTGTATRHLYELSEPQIKDPDEEMMNQLMAYLEQHISDENLRIEDMAEAVGLGRSVFYSKMKELVGVSPSDFLKQLRMQRACQLVANSKLTFSEIAYAVGFTDPKYFSKCFKKETGKTPSAYRKL